MICKYCGKDFPDSDKFCMFCGKEVVDEDDYSVSDNSNGVSERIDFTEGWECGVCGAPITRGDKFCCSCSTPIAWDDEDSDPAAALAVRVAGRDDSREIRSFFDGEDEWKDSESLEDEWKNSESLIEKEATDPVEEKTVSTAPVTDGDDSAEDSAVTYADPAERGSKLKGDLAGGRMRKSSVGYGESKHFKKAGDL